MDRPRIEVFVELTGLIFLGRPVCWSEGWFMLSFCSPFVHPWRREGGYSMPTTNPSHCSTLGVGCWFQRSVLLMNSYLLGSYRIATAPEPNSSRLTSFKSTRFDS